MYFYFQRLRLETAWGHAWFVLVVVFSYSNDIEGEEGCWLLDVVRSAQISSGEGVVVVVVYFVVGIWDIWAHRHGLAFGGSFNRNRAVDGLF
jgi:hypothetical protein